MTLSHINIGFIIIYRNIALQSGFETNQSVCDLSGGQLYLLTADKRAFGDGEGLKWSDHKPSLIENQYVY